MSGALKGYRYVTALDGRIASRHHKPEAALAFKKLNAHSPLVAYKLSSPMPVTYGDKLPGLESTVRATVLEETEPAERAKGTYR